MENIGKIQNIIWYRSATRGPKKKICCPNSDQNSVFFFDILVIFLSFRQSADQKIDILRIFSQCGPKSNLGWPPHLVSPRKNLHKIKDMIKFLYENI
jgi:hypothetical protein